MYYQGWLTAHSRMNYMFRYEYFSFLSRKQFFFKNENIYPII